MPAPTGYKKAPEYKHIKGHSPTKRGIEADRAAYRLAGLKTRVKKEGNGYQIYVKK